MTSKAALLVGILWLVSSIPVPAHHAFAAEFDINSPVTVTGSVTKVEWMNPHVWFYIDLKAESGAGNLGHGNGQPQRVDAGRMDANVDGDWRRGDRRGLPREGWYHHCHARAVTLTKTGKRLFAASSQ